MVEVPLGKSHMKTGLLKVVRMMREPQRVVGMTHNLMGSHKRGLEAGGSTRSVSALVGRLRLMGTHTTVKEREICRRVK